MRGDLALHADVRAFDDAALGARGTRFRGHGPEADQEERSQNPHGHIVRMEAADDGRRRVMEGRAGLW